MRRMPRSMAGLRYDFPEVSSGIEIPTPNISESKHVEQNLR